MELKQLSKQLIALSNKRGKNRQDGLNSFCDSFILNLKQDGIQTFSRDMLLTMLEDSNIKRTAKFKLVETVLALLIVNDKVKTETISKRCYSFRARPLFSYDYGSFALLMKSNGYKRTELYDGFTSEYFEHLNHLTNRHGEHTAVYSNSSKPRNKQGCYSGGKLSIVREATVYNKNIFVVN